MSDKNLVKDVIIITTGGTIEKMYDEYEGTLENRAPAIKSRIQAKLRLPYTNIHVRPLLSKDSLYMDDADRELICKTIEEEAKKEVPIVVVHGTDTMTLTAEYCFKKIGHPNVPVIFTGAMTPMMFEDSDATQNLTEALFATNIMPPGFYISFHNRIFTVPGVQKNKVKRTFEAI